MNKTSEIKFHCCWIVNIQHRSDAIYVRWEDEVEFKNGDGKYIQYHIARWKSIDHFVCVDVSR